MGVWDNKPPENERERERMMRVVQLYRKYTYSKAYEYTYGARFAQAVLQEVQEHLNELERLLDLPLSAIG